MALTTLEIFYGSFTLVSVVISAVLGIFIAFKYRKFKKIEFLLVGITWLLLGSPYWSDAVQFIYELVLGVQISSVFYFFIANAFIAPIHITWMIALTRLIFTNHKKSLISIFSIEAVLFEIFFLIMFFINPSLIGDQKSAFVVEWALWIQIYLLVSIILFLITGFMFAGRSLKADDRVVKLKGIFLIIAFVCFTLGAIIDVIAADAPTELTILLARTFLILSSICFYIGFTMPRFIKEIFSK